MPTQKNILLVEGKDDLNVIAHLLRHHLAIEKVEEVVNIQDKESVNNLLDGLRNDLQRSELERLGIILDADFPPENRWAALRDRLTRLADITVAGLPTAPAADGLIFPAQRQDREVRVGVWLMPDNQRSGMLEDFVSFLVPAGDLLWGRTKTVVADIPTDQRRFPTQHQSKAEIHTWLAWQEEPGKPLGLAIRARYLDAAAPHAQRFVGWLRQLFDL